MSKYLSIYVAFAAGALLLAYTLVLTPVQKVVIFFVAGFAAQALHSFGPPPVRQSPHA